MSFPIQSRRERPQKWDYTTQNLADIDDTAGHKYFQFAGGLNFLGVQNLTAGVDTAIQSAAIPVGGSNETVYGEFKIGGGAKHQITPAIYGQLKGGFKDVYKTTDGKGSGDTEIAIGLEVGYTLSDKCSMGLNFDLTFNGKSNHGKDGFANDNSLGKYHGGSAIAVKPKFTAEFGNGAKFVTFYKIAFTTKGYKDGEEAPKTNTNHTVQLDFIWSF